MATAKVNNIELNYVITGKGEPVVLVHGHPFDHTMWNPQVAALADTYQVITPDLRGYGKSTVPYDAPTQFEDYATDILQLLDHLGIDQFHLTGLSFGGQIVMEVFRQAPERIKSLIFADTFAAFDTPEVKQGRFDTADRIEKEGMDNYSYAAIYKMIKPDHVQSMPNVAHHVLKMMKETSPKAAAIALRARANRKTDYLNVVLPKINIPTLVIVGRDDEFTPVSMAEDMRSKLKNCTLKVIEDSGHMPNLEHPEEVNKVILAFISSVN